MGGEGGGYGSMWAGVVGAVWVVWVAGRTVRWGGGGCAGGGVCGGCGWWVVGAVKAQCERWGR